MDGLSGLEEWVRGGGGGGLVEDGWRGEKEGLEGRKGRSLLVGC